MAGANRTVGFRLEFLALLWAALLLPLSVLAIDNSEQHFDVLQIGTRSYTNVTITSKTPIYVFILHSQGMESLKVKELPREALIQFGYITNATSDSSNAPATWTKQTMAKIETPQVRQYEKAWQTWSKNTLAPLRSQSLVRSWLAQAILGAFILLYFFFCYAGKRICEKAGQEPSILIWLPFFQRIPLLRAAGMSAWWILAFYVPFVNLIAYMVWCGKLASACGKGFLTTLFLILPGTNILAYLYLAFSSSEEAEPPPKVAIAREEAAFEIRT